MFDGSCPSDGHWAAFTPLISRFPVGAAVRGAQPRFPRDGSNETLPSYAAAQPGKPETGATGGYLRMTIDHLPAHDHDLPALPQLATDRDRGEHPSEISVDSLDRNRSTSRAGRRTPEQSIPPYYSVVFCRREK